MIAAGYSIHLYCDLKKKCHWINFPNEYLGEIYGECKRQAQKTGWIFTRDGKHICPMCSGKKRRFK